MGDSLNWLGPIILHDFSFVRLCQQQRPAFSRGLQMISFHRIRCAKAVEGFPVEREKGSLDLNQI